MNGLLWAVVVLVAVWFLGVVVFKVVGFAIHLALLVAAALLVVWIVRKLGGTNV